MNKEELFNKYSNNLKDILSFFPNIKFKKADIYVCPLCKRSFERSSLKHNSKTPLTLEHILPRSVGGKETVLTCKQCNNSHGSIFDSQLKKMLETKKFGDKTPGASKNASFMINNSIPTNGRIFFNREGKANFLFKPERTNPKFHNAIENIFKSEQLKFDVNFTIQTFDKNKFDLALLRTAYLKAFKELGYAFIYSVNSDKLRNLIMNYNNEESKFEGVYTNSIFPNTLDLYYFKKPPNLKGYLVTISIKSGNLTEVYGVVLPGADEIGAEIYSELSRMKDNKYKSKLTEIQMTRIRWEDVMKDKDDSLLALTLWGSNITATNMAR